MTDEAHAAPPERLPPWPMIIGIAVLGVLGLVLLLLVLTRDDDDANASGSAMPTPSATATTSGPAVASPASPTPATSGAAAAPPSPGIALPDGLLPAGSMVTVIGDGVRIRSAPTTEAEVLAIMAAGDLVHVRDSIAAGPIAAGGYEWYQVEYRNGDDVWPWQDLAPDGLVSGWMAAGGGEQRFVALADASCPAEAIALEDLAFRLTSWERLVCIGDTVAVEGTFGCDTCADEVTPGTSPAWLADVEQQRPIARQYAYYPYVLVAVAPESRAPENRDIVRATLRVDHPAASSCTYVPEPDEDVGDVTYDPRAVEMFCRERLVLESFEVIGTDDFGR